MIILRRLWLDGWLSYNKAEFSLDKRGITRIAGDVGSGKSAIPEAIFYLLFGKTLRGKDSVNDLANKVLDNGYEISIEFSVGDNDYKVKEIRGRPKSGVYFYTNGAKTPGKTDPDTRKRIVKALGMSADDFRSIAFLGQRQTQLLVEGKPAERGKAIVDIFSLNRYDEIIKRCETDIKEAIEDKKTLEENLERFTGELEHLENSLANGPEECDEVSQKDLENVDKKITEVSNKISKIRKLASAVREVIAKAKAIKEQKRRLTQLTAEIDTLKEALAKKNRPTESIEELDDLIEALQEDYAEIQNTVRRARRSIEKAKEMDNTCPVTKEDCPVNIPVDKRTETIKKNKKKLSSASEQLRDVEKELEDRKGSRREAKEYATQKERIALKKAAIGDIKKTVQKVGDISAEKKKLEKYEQGISEGDERLTKLIGQRTEVRASLAVAEERRAMQEKIDAALDEKEEAIEELKKQVTDKSIEVQYLSGALAVFKKMKMYKIDLVLQLINENLKEILEQISDGEYKAEFVSQKKTADNKKTIDKIRVLVYDSHKVIPIELCSGGQATEVGLSVLLSTWKTANSISNKGVSSLWLDEVFGPLNEDIVNRTFDAVIDVANSLGAMSVNIISHRDLDPRLFDYCWEIKRKNGISSAKIY